MKFEDIKKFKGNESPNVKEIHPKQKEDIVLVSAAGHPVFEQIFAPDPETGNPRSDLGMFLSSKNDPAFREFIREQLLQPNPNSSVAPDADTALRLVGSRDIEEYRQRITSFLEEINPKVETKDE